jgi:hypothetical protein
MGQGNQVTSLQGFVSGLNNQVTGSNSFIHGEQCITNNANCFIGGGYSNQTRADMQFVTGQFAKPRIASAIGFANGGFIDTTTSTVLGSAQTQIFNMYAQTNSTPVGSFCNFLYQSTIGTPGFGIPISVETSSFFMNTVNMSVTGYERAPATGAVAGDGIFYGQYRFHVYWDNNRALSFCDVNGTTAATNTSTVLSTISFTNKLAGTPLIEVACFISTTGTLPNLAGFYALRVKSGGINPTNWLAQMNVGELMAAQ